MKQPHDYPRSGELIDGEHLVGVVDKVNEFQRNMPCRQRNSLGDLGRQRRWGIKTALV